MPLAIVAPIPVSALVHSSTLVVIGLYFLFRFNMFINLNYLFWFSVRTILFYGFNIMVRFDFKKIMALSTINHIRLMIVYIYLNIFRFIFLYILIHALFKSIVFICIGVIIYYNFDIQDIRKLSIVNYFKPEVFFFYNSKNYYNRDNIYIFFLF